MDFLTSVNMHQNELQNFSIQKLGAAPSTPVLGQFYMDSDGSALHVYTVKGWSNVNIGSVDTGSTAPTSPTNGQVYYNSSDKRFYFYDGAAWIGLVTVAELNLKAPKASPAFTGTATITSAVTKASGSATDVFTVKSSDAQELFKVKGNGDTVIGGLLTVNGTGTSTFAGDVTIGGHLTVEQDATVTLGLSGNSMTLTGDLAVQGNTALGDNAAIDTTTIKGVTTIKSDVTKAVGSSSVNIFKVVDSTDTPLFEVRKNGDTVVGGVLTVNGTGTSTFAGDVSINGNLIVDKNATVTAQMTGTDLTLTGNLVVNGNTTLGDTAADLVTIKGTPKVVGGVTKALGSSSVNAFSVVDSTGTAPLFEVRQNGDTVIGGILTVNGTGTSTFAGNVNIGGKLTVSDTATVTAAMAGSDLTLTGNLVVQGNTTLGDAVTDTLLIKAKPTIQSAVTKAAGNATDNAFSVVDSTGSTHLFDVKTNGDAVIGGILTVSGTGTSTFAGDVSIGGKLTVADTATATADLAGTDLTLTGNLVVNGSTTLGDNAATDTTIIKGLTTVQGSTVAGSATDVTLMKFIDSAGTQVARVDQDGFFEGKGLKTTNGYIECQDIQAVANLGICLIAGNSSIQLSTEEGGVEEIYISSDNITFEDSTIKCKSGAVFDFNNAYLAKLPTNTTIGAVTAAQIGYLSGVTSAVQTQLDNKVAKNANITAGTATKITYDAKGLVTAGTTLAASDIPTLTSAKISDLATTVKGYKLNEFAAPTAAVSMGSKKITDLAAPTLGSDAVTKDYADALRAGISVKDPVKVATTANIALSGTQTIDGVAVVAGNRVLVKNQTAGAENGIYIVASGAWTRAADSDNMPGSEIVAGTAVWVNEGTTNADSRWVLTTNDTITLGTTALTFTKDFQASDIVAGTGLTKTGSTLNVVGTANRIIVNTDSIDIASNYAGQTSITTLGTITAGTWNGATIDVAHGGTGATTAVAARTNLGATGKYAADIGDGSATTIDVIHNLNSLDVVVQLKDKASPANMVMCDVQYKNANTITLLFGAAPTAAQYRVVVIG